MVWLDMCPVRGLWQGVGTVRDHFRLPFSASFPAALFCSSHLWPSFSSACYPPPSSPSFPLFFFSGFLLSSLFQSWWWSPEYCFIKLSAGSMARGFVATVVQTRCELNGSEFTQDPRLEGEIAMDHDGPLPGLMTQSHSKLSNWPAAPV